MSDERRILWIVNDDDEEYFEVKARIRKDDASYEGLKIVMLTHVLPVLRKYFEPHLEES